MIYVVSGQDAGRYSALMEQVYRLRHKVFAEELGRLDPAEVVTPVRVAGCGPSYLVARRRSGALSVHAADSRTSCPPWQFFTSMPGAAFRARGRAPAESAARADKSRGEDGRDEPLSCGAWVRRRARRMLRLP